MKGLHIVLAIILVALYNAAEKCTDIFTPSKASECNSLKVDDGFYKCCYIYTKISIAEVSRESKSCTEINKTTYDNIKDFVTKSKEAMEKTGSKVSSFDVDCSSKYLYISLLSLMVLLI